MPDYIDVDRTEYMLSTIDNPFDPFTQFDEWYAYDLNKGYDSLGLVARVSFANDALSDKENALLDNYAIDGILETDATGLFIKIPYPKE